MHATPRIEIVTRPRKRTRRESEFDTAGDSVKKTRAALDRLLAITGLHDSQLDDVRSAVLQDVKAARQAGEDSAISQLEELLD